MSKLPKDKRNNRVVAIPGSPGIGKSSFLTHFPESQEYYEYLNKVSPIVSTLTFNSGMECEKDLFGLRILYGAAKAMGLFTAETIELSFDDFVKNLDSTPSMDMYDNFTAKDAIEILQRIFDHNVSASETTLRPMIILVDELRVSKNSDEVASQIGSVLDKYGHVDVLVSSLSPEYIEKLFTGSKRSIEYVVISPLLDAKLGYNETKKWAEKLINSTNKTVKIDEFKENVLRNIYLLFSGHPRSLERMVEIMNSGRIDSKVIDNLSKNKRTATSLLHLLVDELCEAAVQSNVGTVDLYERYVLKTPPLFEVGNVGFRDNLEEGRILIVEKKNTKYVTGIPVISFLNKLQLKTFNDKDPSYENCRAANKLLKTLTRSQISLRPGTWWEKIVSFTIHSRHVGESDTDELLGVKSSRVIRDEERKLDITESKNRSNIITNMDNDQLFIPFNHTAGFDALIVLHKSEDEGCQAFFYLQTKIAPSTTTPLPIVVAKMIRNSLNHYLGVNNTILSIDRKKDDSVFDDFHMVLYQWGLKDEEIRQQISQDIILDLLLKPEDSIASQFVKSHWEQIHFVGIDTLRSWVNPTLLPLAKMFSNIQNGSKVGID